MTRKVVGSTPTVRKSPTSSDQAGREAPIRFRVEKLEDGEHPLHKIERQHHKRLLKCMKRLEGMTVQQAISNKDLAIFKDLSACPNQSASQKLSELLQGYGEAFDGSPAEIRVAKSESLRIIGLLNYENWAAEFYLLWWDPNHEIWPEGKIKK